ncbi:hypothetical protein BD770DRAFT_409113 [Pilaira anomala]|nr:hypothetical protein BD770DRAFT_409113 [Pilaira anomala]
MSDLPKHQPENICYRCRNTTQMDNELLQCSECTQLWHYKCLSSPQELMPKDEWICPRHQKASKRASFSRKRVAKTRAREEIIEEFEVAEQIIKYGGVTHELSTKTLESDFLNYARRYRQVKHPQKKNNKIDAESQTDQYDIPACFEFQDGIQMLLDAANRPSEES